MDRMELLKLALSSVKDAREALALAREMEAFIAASGHKDAPAEAEPAARKPRKSRASGAGPERRMTADDLRQIKELRQAGHGVERIARAIGFSTPAVRHRLRTTPALNGAAASH